MQIWCEHSSGTLRGEKGEMAAQQCRWDSLTCGAAWGREASFHRSVIWSECPSIPENYPIIHKVKIKCLAPFVQSLRRVSRFWGC